MWYLEVRHIEIRDCGGPKVPTPTAGDAFVNVTNTNTNCVETAVLALVGEGNLWVTTRESGQWVWAAFEDGGDLTWKTVH